MDYLIRTDLSENIGYKIAVHINMVIFFLPFMALYLFRIIKDNIITLVCFIISTAAIILSIIKLNIIIKYILQIITYIDTGINCIIAVVMTLFTIPNHFFVN